MADLFDHSITGPHLPVPVSVPPKTFRRGYRPGAPAPEGGASMVGFFAAVVFGIVLASVFALKVTTPEPHVQAAATFPEPPLPAAPVKVVATPILTEVIPAIPQIVVTTQTISSSTTTTSPRTATLRKPKSRPVVLAAAVPSNPYR